MRSFCAVVILIGLGCSAGFAQVAPQGPSGGGTSGVEPLPQSPAVGQVQPIAPEQPSSGTVQVMAEGTATIYAGNVEKARQAALRQAYAEAVARGAGIAVGSLTIVTNVKKVSDVVMSRSRGFVRTYDVISEGVVDGDTYRIRINAEVVLDRLDAEDEREGLRLYLRVLGDPKLLIMLPRYDASGGVAGAGGASSGSQVEIDYKDHETELTVRKSADSSTAGAAGGVSDIARSEPSAPVGIFSGVEAAIAQSFSRYGYQVQTSDDVAFKGLVPDEVMRRARQGVTEDVLAVARAANADLALFGVMRVSSRAISPHGVDFISVTGEASAKAMIVSSGYLLEAFHVTKTKAHPNPLGASSAVLDSVADEFAATLAWKIPSILVNHPRESRLVLEGVTVDEAEKVRAVLAELPEVDAVRFLKLPTQANRENAELLVLTGFIRIDEEELYRVARDVIPTSSARCRFAFELADSDKYQIRLNRCGSMTL